MPLESETDVNELRDVKDATGATQPPSDGSAPKNENTGVAVDATGEIIKLDTRGKQNLDIGLKGAGNSATYQVEASPDGSKWYGPYKEYSSVQQINDGLLIGARWVRIVVSTAASGGTTADVFLGAS